MRNRSFWKKDYQDIKSPIENILATLTLLATLICFFGAAKLNLKIVEVPIRYKARDTEKQTFLVLSTDVALLKMVFAMKKIKFK